MPNMTIRIPEDLKEDMEKHKEVNWSEVARKSMWKFLWKLELANRIASESEMTEKDLEELSKKIKKDIAKHY